MISQVDDLNWFLGMQIRHGKVSQEIFQENYIEMKTVAEKKQLSKSDCPDEGSQVQ